MSAAEAGAAEPHSGSPPPRQEPGEDEKVNYEASSETVSIGVNLTMKNIHGLSDNELPEADSTLDGDSTVLLGTKSERKCLPCCKMCPSYRSSNPSINRSITPFSLVLLVVLLVVYILNQADRLVLPVVIPTGLRCEAHRNECTKAGVQLEEDLFHFDENLSNSSTKDCIHFDDNEQGLLTGPAFTVIYVVAGLPLARLADTRSRPFVLLLGVVLWSVMIFLTGFVVTFWQLLLLRMLLGIGEAACNPVVYSLLADFYPERHRAFVFSVYHYGVYVGGALGWMIAYVNEVLDWRWTFIILGISGFIVTPLVALALWEPKVVRNQRLERRRGKNSYSIREVFLALVKSPPYLLLLTAGSVRNISGYALGAWLPTFFVRRYNVDPSDFSIPVGLVVLFGGGLGSFLGGFISDRLSSKNAKAYVIAVSQLLAVPCIIGVLLSPRATTSYGILFLAYVTAETWLGPAAAIVQDLTMPAMRAQASAIYIGVITIVASIGPVLVPGVQNLAPFLDPCTNGVGYALLMIVPTFYLLSAFLFAALGAVIMCWDKKTGRQDLYEEVKN